MGFKATVLRALDIEASELSKVSLLLGMGFFMGIFLATLDVGASSLFLNNLEEAEIEKQLPLAILTAGSLGIIFTAIYSFLQGRIPFTYLAPGAIVVVTVFLMGIEWAFRNFDDLRNVYFFAFTFIVPSNFIVLLVFWGAFGRMFNLRQSKRIIGSIDTGQLVASILALFSIPVLLNYIRTENLLFVSLLSMGGLFVMLLIIIQKKLFVKGIRSGSSRVKYASLFKNKYIALMAIFVTVSMIAVNFVDYSFLNMTKLQFDEKSLPNFLSYFEATVVIFSFLFQTFVTDKIIAIYGLKVSLLINPILIGLFTALAIPIGFFFGYSVDSGSLIFFFIIISMSKLFNASLKDALDGPAFKLYFLPIDSSIRFDVQTKIEGVITAFAGLLAGTLLIAIENIRGLDLIYISVFTLPLMALWYVVTTKMHNNYRLTLQDSLVKNKSTLSETAESELGVDRILKNELDSPADEKVIYGLKLMEKLEPALYELSVVELLESESPRVREYAKEQAKKLDLELGGKSAVGHLARQAADHVEDSDLISIGIEKLEILSKSGIGADRFLAAKLIRQVTDPKRIFILLELLRDVEPKVKMEAIATSRKLRLKETYGVLIELLDSPTYCNAAAAALVECGTSVLFSLETAFHKSGQSDMVMIKIVQVIGRIGGNNAMELLWKKIEYPDRRIVKQILLSLRYYNYQAREREITLITTLLENEIGKAIWNMAAIQELPNIKHFVFLRNALKEEVNDNFEMIYILLSILYDPQSVQLVRENVDIGTPDGAAYAIELLDLFVAPDLKPKLFPLVDDIDVDEKLNKLQAHFPREKYTEIQVLNYILNRNYNQANRWTKACALYSVVFMPDFRISRGLVAHLFNIDPMLQEAAAWVIYNKDQEAFHRIASRLPAENKQKLEETIRNNTPEGRLKDGFYLRMEMVMFLKKVPEFRNIKGLILANMVDKMQNLNLAEGRQVKVNRSEEEEEIFIIADGAVMVENEGTEVVLVKKGEVFGNVFRTGERINATGITAHNTAVLFVLPVFDFFNIMAHHHELAQVFLKNIEKKLLKTAGKIKN